MPITLQHQQVIICEGKADKAFFSYLIAQRNLPPFDVIEPAELPNVGHGPTAYTGLLLGLSANPNFKNVSAILVTADNDDDPDGNFRGIQGQIRETGILPVPERPLDVARDGEFPAIIIMMIPWAGIRGALETLCLDAIYERYPDLRRCVDAYSLCTGTNVWETTTQSKMRLQSLISALCHSDPNRSLAHIWGKPDCPVDLNRDCFNRIAEFLRNLQAYVHDH